MYGLDRIAHNIKLYIKRHIYSIEIIFLLTYTLLNLALSYVIDKPIVSVFIILFLFILGVEKVILHLKFETDKRALEGQQEQIDKETDEFEQGLIDYISSLEEENNLLRRRGDILNIRLKDVNHKSK